MVEASCQGAGHHHGQPARACEQRLRSRAVRPHVRSCMVGCRGGEAGGVAQRQGRCAALSSNALSGGSTTANPPPPPTHPSRPRSISSCRRRSSTDGRRSAPYLPHSLLPTPPCFLTPTHFLLFTEKPAPCTAPSERNEIKAIGEHHSELLVLAARLLRVRPTQLEQRLLCHHTHGCGTPHYPCHIAATPVKLPLQPCMCRPSHEQCARACRPATTSRARQEHLLTPRSRRRYAPM